MQNKNGNKNAGPDFLGIGAPRSGTTWLHTMLSKHPDIWMPPIKEVHYFDSVDPTLRDLNMTFNTDKLSDRYKRHFYNRLKHYPAYLLKQFTHSKDAKPDLLWDYKFFKPGSSLEWYQELFNRPTREGLIKGEITPAYITLSNESIQKISDVLKVKKLILLLRNPLYSTWSSIEKQVRDGLKLGESSESDLDELISKIQSPRLFRRFGYADNLDRWLGFYDQKDIYIGFFEELQESPSSVLSKVFSYLEVEDISDQLTKDIEKRINRSSGVIGNIPREIKYEIARLHHDQIDRLRQRIQGYPDVWYEEIQMALKEGK